MTMVEVLILCGMQLLSLVIGVVIGQKVARKEKIELNPVKVVNAAITHHKEAMIKEAEDEYYKTIYQNIDNYTGDSIGQIDVPKRK